jgi:hypothetical protein
MVQSDSISAWAPLTTLRVWSTKIERSKCEPGVRTVSKLAKTLGVSASELFDDIDGRDMLEDGGSGHTERPPARQDCS